MHFAIEIQGDNGHSGGKASHRVSKLRGIQAHCRRDVACRVSHHFSWCRRLRRSQPRLYGCRRLPYHAPPLYHSSNVTRTAITLATPRQRSACASALDAVRPGIPISRESALHLIRCSEDELPELLVAARAVKERFKPGIITYSRKVFLPLTNLCRDYCGYCTFRRDPGDPGAHTMTPDEVLSVARAGGKTRMHRSPVQPRRQARITFPRDARNAAPSRLQVDAALSGSHVPTRAARD